MTENFNLICKALHDTYDTNLLRELLEPSTIQLFQEVSEKLTDSNQVRGRKILMDLINNIRIAKSIPKYLNGPTALNVLYNSTIDYGKTICLIGEIHGSNSESRICHNGVGIDEYLRDMFDNTNVFIDFFYEREGFTGNDSVLPKASLNTNSYYIDKIDAQFQDCIYTSTRKHNPLCKLFRAHYMMPLVRRGNIGELTNPNNQIFIGGHITTMLDKLSDFVGYSALLTTDSIANTAHAAQEFEHIVDSLNSIELSELEKIAKSPFSNNMNVTSSIYTDEVYTTAGNFCKIYIHLLLNSKNIKKELTKVPTDIRDKILGYYIPIIKGVIADNYNTLIKSVSKLYHMVKIKAKTYKELKLALQSSTEIKYILATINSKFTDIYTLSRMFREFDVKSSDQPKLLSNIVVYGGISHIERITQFLIEELSFDVLDSAVSVQGKEACIDTTSITSIF